MAKDFPIVCVGGSAGGLDAYIRLLKNLPANLGVAIVIVNHITIMPTQLHEVLPGYTTMPVELITERLSIEPARPRIVHHPIAKSAVRPQSPVQYGGRRAAVADEPAPEVLPQKPARLTIARPDSPAAPERKARLIATSGTAPLPSVPAVPAPKRPAEPAPSWQKAAPAWAAAGFSSR